MSHAYGQLASQAMAQWPTAQTSTLPSVSLSPWTSRTSPWLHSVVAKEFSWHMTPAGVFDWYLAPELSVSDTELYEQLLSCTSVPLHWKFLAPIPLVPRPNRLLVSARAPLFEVHNKFNIIQSFFSSHCHGSPSCLQTTLASFKSQLEAEIAPQIPWAHSSTLPSNVLLPSTRRTSPALQLSDS